MANAKNGRKQPLIVVIMSIVLSVLTYLGINVSDFTQPNNQPTITNTSESQENTQDINIDNVTTTNVTNATTKPSNLPNSNNGLNSSNSDNQENPEHSNGTSNSNGTTTSQADVLEVTMISVGQADSFLLRQKGKTCLIDCGTLSDGKEVVQYLKDNGIKKLDYLIGTHPHEDHVGGMKEILNNFKVGKLILPEVTKTNITPSWYNDLLDEIIDKEYNLYYPTVGKTYSLGNCKMKVLAPLQEPDDNINNYSIVLKVSFGEMDILFTGDAEKDVEKLILKNGTAIDAEVLKVGHHGSNTSTSEKFLDAVNPDYALISAGVGNRYSHPSDKIMKELEERNITVYRTDECGTVVMTVTYDSISFNTNPGDYASGAELKEKVKGNE